MDIHVLAIEKELVEVPQLLRRDGAVLLLHEGRGVRTIRRGLLFGALRAPGEGEHAGRRRQQNHGAQGQLLGLPVCGDTGDPLPEALFVRGHGGSGQQRVPRHPPDGDQAQQGPAVGQPLLLPQGPDGALVAGQLAVRPGGRRGDPHQGVEPVHRQAHAPQQGPQGVQVPGVGLLVGQHVAQALLALQGGGGQIDGGPQDAEQARRRQGGLHHIHPVLTAGDLHAHPAAAQLPGEGEVGPQQSQGHRRRPGQPDGAQGLDDGQMLLRGRLRVLCRRGGRGDDVGLDRLQAGTGGLRPSGGKAGGLRRRGGYGDRRSGKGRGLQPGGDRLPHRLRHGQHAEIQGGQGDGNHQPHQHQRPQGVLYPAGYLLTEDPPQRQQR